MQIPAGPCSLPALEKSVDPRHTGLPSLTRETKRNGETPFNHSVSRRRSDALDSSPRTAGLCLLHVGRRTYPDGAPHGESL